jgi:hypothetical protein
MDTARKKRGEGLSASVSAVRHTLTKPARGVRLTGIKLATLRRVARTAVHSRFAPRRMHQRRQQLRAGEVTALVGREAFGGHETAAGTPIRASNGPSGSGAFARLARAGRVGNQEYTQTSLRAGAAARLQASSGKAKALRAGQTNWPTRGAAAAAQAIKAKRYAAGPHPWILPPPESGKRRETIANDGGNGVAPGAAGSVAIFEPRWAVTAGLSGDRAKVFGADTGHGTIASFGIAGGLPGTEVPAPSSNTTDGGRERMSGDVYLDGTRVGRWLEDLMDRQAGRPPAGPTSFDSRMSQGWTGLGVA